MQITCLEVAQPKTQLLKLKVNTSQGRGTDYYIIIDTDFGESTLRVSKKNYSKFKKGETLRADVQEGLFSGYYIMDKLK